MLARNASSVFRGFEKRETVVGNSVQIVVAAQLVRLSEGTIRRVIRLGRLQSRQVVGKQRLWLIEREDLERWFAGLNEKSVVDKNILKECEDICRELGVERPVFEKPAPEAAPQIPEGKAKSDFL